MRLPATTPDQLELFDGTPQLRGFAYAPDLISGAAELQLISQLAGLAFRDFAFRGFVGKRRTISFGWRFDFNSGRLERAESIPGFVHDLRVAAARFAGIEPRVLEHVLLTDYPPGAVIGWHRDRPEFGDVVGVSLLSPARLRFRRRTGTGWQREAVELAPRSAYLLRGEARTLWEHSIPAAATRRVSISFRSLAGTS